jgi:ABC-type antimicrobial peptide transport system permease subunit
MLVALVGGVVGVGLDILAINHALGPLLENGGGFREFHTPVATLATALGAAVVLGVIAGAVPALQASRLKVTDALRRLE